MEPSSSGAGSGRHRGYSSGEYREFRQPLVQKAKRKKKLSALTREDLVKVDTFKEAIRGLSKVETLKDIKTDYSLGSNEIIESWQELLAPKSLEALEQALAALSPMTQAEAETIVEIVAPQLIEEFVEPEPEKPKRLEFSDDELLLAVGLMKNKLKPRMKLEFTDEELLLAAFLVKNKRNKK